MTTKMTSPEVRTLCIPRAFSNISEQKIRKIFDSLRICEIKKIDIISKKGKNGEVINRVFVHLNKWFINENAIHAHNRLLEGKDIKIIYDEPWYWKVSAYTSNSSNSTTCIKQNKKQLSHIDLKPEPDHKIHFDNTHHPQNKTDSPLWLRRSSYADEELK